MHARPHRFSSIPSATGGITRLACERLRAHGKDVSTLLSKVGLTPANIDDRSKRIDVRAQIDFLNRAAAALSDELLGFHLAQDFDLREIGLVYYIVASSQEIAEALYNAQRYCRIVNEGVQLRVASGAALDIGFEYVNVDRRSDRHQIEFWLVTMMRLVRQIADSRLVARHLRIGHSPASGSGELESFFGVGAEFDSDADTITLAPSVAALPIVGRDSHLNDLLRGYAEEALSARTQLQPGLRMKIEQIVPGLLMHGRADLKNVARGMNMSPRTLSRRLGEEGLTYRVVVSELRSALARRYLRESEMLVSQIAWLLGFEEVSSFTHAFKRWTGMTPRQFRLSFGSSDRIGRNELRRPAATRA